jgi:hypothetical protein
VGFCLEEGLSGVKLLLSYKAATPRGPYEA